jgi:serine-type D-Ala-D-Ala endopeptidase (penicillin-binding protein 7)
MRTSIDRCALALATTVLLAYATALKADTQTPGNDPASRVASAYSPTSAQSQAAEKFWVLAGKPQVRSSAVVIFDEADESLLYAKNAKQAMPIASITKLMTALVVRDADQDLNEVLTITTEDRDTEKGTTSRLLIGTELTRADLLHLALMSSENRAAHALGRNYPGGLKAFVRAMNAKAKELGMKSARFVEPTGLSSSNVSSAADLVKLVTAASRDPLIRHYSTNQSHEVEVGNQILQFRNSNSLTSKEDWHIALQKTGYTSEAGRCLVMTAFVQERPVVMVLLNSVGKYTRIADARRVRMWMERSIDEAPRYARAAAGVTAASSPAP